MQIWTRKYGSQRGSRVRKGAVELCVLAKSDHFVIEDHGPEGAGAREPDFIILKPESLEEIRELREWLTLCENSLKGDK